MSKPKAEIPHPSSREKKEPKKTKTLTRGQNKELIQRTAKVAELMMQGLTGGQIWQYASEKLHWKTSERNIYRYMKAANEQFAKEAQAKHSEEFGKALRRLNYLFANCLKIQDYKGALAMQREINEMMGFRNKYEVKEIPTQDDLDTSKLSKEEREALAALSRKLRTT